MENILKELHYLNDDIKARNRAINANARKTEHLLAEYEEFLLKRLKGKDLRILKKMTDVLLDFAADNAENAFANGAKIGAKLIIDLLVS